MPYAFDETYNRCIDADCVKRTSYTQCDASGVSEADAMARCRTCPDCIAIFDWGSDGLHWRAVYELAALPNSASGGQRKSTLRMYDQCSPPAPPITPSCGQCTVVAVSKEGWDQHASSPGMFFQIPYDCYPEALTTANDDIHVVTQYRDGQDLHGGTVRVQVSNDDDSGANIANIATGKRVDGSSNYQFEVGDVLAFNCAPTVPPPAPPPPSPPPPSPSPPPSPPRESCAALSWLPPAKSCGASRSFAASRPTRVAR